MKMDFRRVEKFETNRGADAIVALPPTSCAWAPAQREVFAPFYEEVFALFECCHRIPNRIWTTDALRGVYWGPLDDKKRPHGRGVLVRETDDPLQAQCCDGEFIDGQVVYAQRWWTSRSSDVYKGDVANQRRHGFGRVTDAPGSLPRLEGTFRDNRLDGLAIERTPDGQIYLGRFKRGQRHGPGYWQTREGTRVRGTHREGVPMPPFHVTLSDERGVWHGDVRGNDACGPGHVLTRERVSRTKILTLAVESDGAHAFPKYEALPRPLTAIVHAEGHVVFSAHPEIFGDDDPSLDAFKRALASTDDQSLQKIMTHWQQISPGVAKNLMRASDSNGCTALHFACLTSRRADVVEKLLSLGADVHACMPHRAQPLHVACGYRSTTRDTVEQLFAEPAFVEPYMAAEMPNRDATWPKGAQSTIAQYRRACRAPSVEVIAALLRAGAEPAAPLEWTSQRNQAIVSFTALETAILGGHDAVVRMMLHRYPRLRSNRSLLGRSAVLAAAAGDAAAAILTTFILFGELYEQQRARARR